jgi:8-oxo-dGTP diphosphatase
MFPIGTNVFAIQDGKLLLGQRKNCVGEGEWGLPGGHLEYHENMEDAAARELLEETSLVAGKLTFVNIVNDNKRNDGGHYVQVGFKAEDLKGEVKLMEPERCSEWKWFPLNALPENIFFGHKKQVEIFLKNIQFGESGK